MACSPELIHKLARWCAIAGALLFMASSVLAVVLSVFTLLIVTPIGWMKVVNSVWNFSFGAIILFLQFGMFGGALTKYAGFLSKRLGRGLFYLYCGNAGGASAAFVDTPFYVVAIAYATFAALWFVGLVELCGPPNPNAPKTPASVPGEVPSLAPLGSSANVAGAANHGSINVTITPEQAMGAAKFAAKNKAVASAAWNAAVATSGGSGGSSGGTASAAPNPFFGAGK